MTTLYRRHVAALLRAGRPAPLLGALLCRDASPEKGAPPVAEGSDTSAADGAPAVGADPEFVISTEGEASDDNIVLQHWDFSRAEGPGIPVLWCHDQRGALLGQWSGLAVEDVAGPTGKARRRTVARCGLDRELPQAEMYRGQIQRRMLRAVSTGWRPGAMTRRGELDPADEYYREAVDGYCGPEEGYVMGSAEEPNVLIECSLVACPADPEAYLVSRLYDRAVNQLERAGVPVERGSGDLGGSLDAVLAVLAGDSRVRSWLRATLLEDEQVRAAILSIRGGQPGHVATSVDDLFSVGN